MNPAIPYSEIDTLFLDVGNTLISMDYAWVAEELAAHGVPCEVSALHRAEAAARPLVSAGLERRSTETEDAFRFYLETVLHCLPGGSDMDPLQLSKISRELAPVLRPAGQAERLWSSVIPGVPDALISLGKAGVQLAAVSNSDGTVEEVLVRQNLRSYLSAVYDSQIVGFEKPDPRIFLYALKDLNADPARTLHVGDLYSIDVEGARAAGLHAVLIDPFGDWKNIDCDRVRDLSELSRKVLEAPKKPIETV
jgi:HAD superfamily hydrolase (TIGR01509 family)